MFIISLVFALLFVVLALLMFCAKEATFERVLSKVLSSNARYDASKLKIYCATLFMLFAIIEIIVLFNQSNTGVLIFCIAAVIVLCIAAIALLDKVCRTKKKKLKRRRKKTAEKFPGKKDGEAGAEMPEVIADIAPAAEEDIISYKETKTN